MSVRLKQLDQVELSEFVAGISTGNAFDLAMTGYANRSGYLGEHILYISGKEQFIKAQKSFELTPLVPSGIIPSGAANKQYVDASISGAIIIQSGFNTGTYARTVLANTFTAANTFTQNISIPLGTATGHGINLQNLLNASGILQSGINNIVISDVLYRGQTQHITGVKIFDVAPLAVNPTVGSGLVTLDYLTGNFSAANTVKTTGSQEVSGIKTFLQSPVIPIAVGSNQAVQKAQLDAAINFLVAASGTGNFVGVASVNDISGRVMIDGAGGISVVSCSGIIYVSGNAQNTSFYSVAIPLSSGITGINFSYNPVFSLEPNVVGTLKYTGTAAISFVDDVIFNSSSGGFNVAFSTGIPSVGYFYNINAVPVSGNSGFLGIQGERGFPGRSFNQRGQWRAGLQYLPQDVVFTPGNFVSYWTTGTAISDSFNAPSGTGTSLWQILSSGNQGPSGYLIWKGTHNTGAVYNQRDAVTFDGSSYVYTGSSPVSGFTPEALTGNWGLVAAKAPLGYFINSGVMTGAYTNLSLFVSPVATGLDLIESFIARTFYYTGFALGAITTGAGPLNGGVLTGRIYQRETNNNKIILQTFTFDSGSHFYRSGDFSFVVTGDNRIGLDIANTLSGIDKFSVGIYGFGV